MCVKGFNTTFYRLKIHHSMKSVFVVIPFLNSEVFQSPEKKIYLISGHYMMLLSPPPLLPLAGRLWFFVFKHAYYVPSCGNNCLEAHCNGTDACNLESTQCASKTMGWDTSTAALTTITSIVHN